MRLIVYIVFIIQLFFLKNIIAQTYPSLNINLLSHINPETDNTGSDGRKYSGCWGWYQPSKNKEYALIGTSSKTYFVDVTNPTSPILCDSVMAVQAGCTWREIKTYQNYCYIVSDDSPPNSFQIVDMQYLPDSVHLVYNGTDYFERCHTIFVDNSNLYCGSVTDVGGTSYSTMRVYSLITPTAPTLIRKLEQDISTSVISVVHDMFVRNDTIFASCGNNGLYILKLTTTGTFSLMQSFTNYPYAGYNHSSWQSDDRKTLVFADEVSPGLPAKVLDMSNINNIILADTIRSNFGATAHNPYIVGNRWCWISSYIDGLYLYDISDPYNTTIYGYFDTYPQHGTNDNIYNPAYRGNWGAYPYLPSKIIIALDMQNGLFILDGDNTYKNTVGIKENNKASILFSSYPNPAKTVLNLVIANQQNNILQFVISNSLGEDLITEQIQIKQALEKIQIPIQNLSTGTYFINIKNQQYTETKKIIIQ
ncbi:MAG: choice-of-anchor B family protein [Bacteroidia bacterium]|nr:choice-of-anchor B family protein [Bacteroidia bacterium]